MRKTPYVAAFISDIHLSHNAPKARAEKDNWYEVQKRYLDQVHAITEEYRVPLFVAGDIFDLPDKPGKPNNPAELVNFAIQNFPHCWAIPGQHDLINHQISNLEKSSFWTLVETGNIHYEKTVKTTQYTVTMFPWNAEITPPDNDRQIGHVINVAVLHAFCWKGDYGHPGADESTHVDAWQEKLKDYDVAVFGDNHSAFLHPGKPLILNCGTFIRRKKDEKTAEPAVYLMTASGEIHRKLLDISQDLFVTEIKTGVVDNRYFETLIGELTEEGSQICDCKTEILNWQRSSSDDEVSSLLTEIVEVCE